MIDLRSDTATRPTESMRDAARDAEVGDDVFGEDPTVNRLEAVAADLLGKEAALFTPSGTMANQVAAMTHTRPGQEIVVESESHIYGWEVGGLAANAGLQVRPLDGGARGLFTPEQLRDAIVSPSLHQAETGLVTVENTHNHAGGVAHHPDELEALREVAHEHDLPFHLDGARVCNAAVALDLDPATVAEPADSVMLSLSKGLGAPVGSILAGDEAFIDTARRYRKRLGGGMRQAGIIAAPALEGISNPGRLARDHERAARLAAGLDDLDGLSAGPPETNIVLVATGGASLSAEEFLTACESAGVLGVPFGHETVRFCTYRGVDDDDIEEAIASVETALRG